MSRNRKGFLVGLTILVIIAAAIFVFASFPYLKTAARLTEIKGKVNIFLEKDDRGTLLTSILQSKMSETDYAEIIGALASGTKKQEDVDKDLNHTLDLLNAEMKIYENKDTILWRHGDVVAEGAETDIALPGGKKGTIKLEVRE